MTETIVTGKVDVFGMALVVMYMYKKYHILLKMITEGKESYHGFDPTFRESLQFKLIIQVKLTFFAFF